MLLGNGLTVLIGTFAFWGGTRFGKVLLRKGATANDLFKGKDIISLFFLGIYLSLMLMALYLPQNKGLPLELRFYGMQITWATMRIMLLGVCGVALSISWKTARLQVMTIALIGLMGLGSFTAAENYFLAPIYDSLKDNLRTNGVFQQTSSSSCAPAALATILRRWQIDATESSVARLAGTSRLGTSMPQLIVAAQALGMDGVELSPTWEQIQRINRPGVLAAWLYEDDRKALHAVALLGLDDDTATVADPAGGKIYQYNRSQFNQIWRKQYVPIFQIGDSSMTLTQSAMYLRKLGFLASPSESQLTQQRLDLAAVKAALRQFQLAMGVTATGELNPETVLLLTGPFLEGVPRLDHPS
jgi:predicted double-glycine peptidase